MASSVGSSVSRWNIAPPRPKVHRELHTPTKVRLPIIRFRLKDDLELEKIVKEAGLKASDRRVLYDSEIADVGVRDFLERRKEFAKSVDGPPRWFSPMECGRPPPDVPLLLYLPGAVPVSATGLFKLLSQNSHVLLYPGGVREALHRKGEEYKLFWPEQSEFVRMAARFGAAIVPFAAVGEDDLCELLLDYDDLVRIPTVKYLIDELNRDLTKLRTDAVGELGQQALHVPVLMPKIPGRMYYLFGKPIETKGREELLRDRKSTHLMYLHVKSEVEKNISYLLQKRKYDPYRTLPSRVLYQAIHGPTSEVPTFSL
ncbi:Acyltransferase-like protein [Nymphaea thermarum]|nr:Acyltransferase-like protein [Nymphaea thermarum]